MEINVVACVLINHKKEILLCKRKGKFAGYWEFPGGKVEKNETLEQALTRELDEELNVHISDFTFVYSSINDYGKETFKVHFFFSTYDGIITSNVHDEIRWLSINDAITLPLLKNNEYILSKMQNLL